MRKGILPALVVAVFSIAATARAGDNWPQWRGPHLNGVSDEKNLPVRWSTEENITWKLSLPAWSGSTPIIWGERIFLNVAMEMTSFCGVSTDGKALLFGRSCSEAATPRCASRTCLRPRRSPTGETSS